MCQENEGPSKPREKLHPPSAWTGAISRGDQVALKSCIYSEGHGNQEHAHYASYENGGHTRLWKVVQLGQEYKAFSIDWVYEWMCSFDTGVTHKALTALEQKIKQVIIMSMTL